MGRWKNINPERMVTCANCGRSISSREYYGVPDKFTDEQTIHVFFTPHLPEVSVICTCGHFTIHNGRDVPPRRRNS